MSLNADVQAPMARASERTAAAEVVLDLLSRRHPNTMSARTDASQGNILLPRVCPR